MEMYVSFQVYRLPSGRKSPREEEVLSTFLKIDNHNRHVWKGNQF